MPSLPSSDDRPYLNPAMPENLKVQSGLENQFILDWDDVEGADYYIIEYASASQPSEFRRAARSTVSSLVINGRDGLGGINIDPDQSYYFSVKAVSIFGSEYRYSIPSDIVEGAMAPENIQFLVFPTFDDVTLVWHSPNQISYDGDFLYEASFKVRYRKTGTDEWTQEITETERVGVIWDTLKLGINKYGFEYNEDYDFQVVMTIHGDIPVEVESPIVTATISENYNPDPISSYNIESDRSDYIGVEWTVPNWANGTLSDDIVFFRIERSVYGSNEWTELVNEITNGDSDLIKYVSGDGSTPELVFNYQDTSAEIGVDYIYRITNCVALSPDISETYYITEPESTSGIGHLFYPEIEAATAEYTMDGPAKAEVKLSFTTDAVLSDTLNLKWGVKKTVVHPDTDVEEVIVGATAEDNSFTFPEILGSNDRCTNRVHEYSYTLLLLREDGSIYCTLNNFEGESLVLDNPPLLDGGILTDNNRVGTIAFSWRVLSDYDDVTPAEYEFSYSFGDGDRQSISSDSIVVSEDGLYSFEFKTDEKDLSVLTLYASAMDEQYYSVATTNARVLAFPDDFSHTATVSDYPDKIHLSWNSSGLIINSIEYGYQYKVVGEEDWITPSNSLTITDNGIDFDRNDIPQDAEVVFRFTASNMNYPDEGFAVSSEINGKFFSAPENITATKGNYSDKVTISWDASDKADSYTLYRYSESDLSDAVEVASSISGTSYDDSSFDPSKPYYTVSAVNSNGMTEKQDSFETITTVFKETEQENIGYLLEGVTEANVSTAEMDESGYYKPYTIVTWKRAAGATKYTISALGESITVNVTGDAGYDHTASFTAGTPDSVGFLSYDGVDTYTYYDNTGTLKDTLDISGYSIMASNDYDSTDAKAIDETVNRQLKEIEYVNFVNTILHNAITSVSFSDWFAAGFIDPSPNTYNDGGLKITTASSSMSGGVNEQSCSNPGWIEMRNYTSLMYPGLNFNTDSSNQDIRIWSDGINGSEGTQYIGTQKLLKIGGLEDDGEARGTVNITDISSGRPLYYSAQVILHNIDVQNKTEDEYYLVSINNGTQLKIKDTDVSVKPY